MLIRSTFLLLTVALATLTGCRESTDQQPADSESDFYTVQDLKEAFQDAGGTCPSWDPSDLIDEAFESGTCGKSKVLSVYDDHNAMLDAVSDLKELNETTPYSATLLIGNNWIINGIYLELEDVEDSLNGRIIEIEETYIDSEESSDPFISEVNQLVPAMDIYDENQISELGDLVCEYLRESESFAETTLMLTDAVEGFEDFEDVTTFTELSAQQICTDLEYLIY